MQHETNTADVLLSFLEYRAFYQEPIFDAWKHDQTLALTIFRAFREWNIGLENISASQSPANASEVKLSVDLFNKRVNFNVGLGSASLFVMDPNWEEAEMITKLARAGIDAVITNTKAEIASQQLVLAMHLKPQFQSIREITSRFIQISDQSLIGNDVRAYGFSIYKDNSSLVVDSSNLYPEGLFVRLARTFGPETPFEDITNTLYKDEARALELLELRLN